MTTALEALATRLTALETDLAGAATAAEVTALQTALAAAQSDLTELLASNNVYSQNLTINSAATLAVAKNLGGKLAIINGNVTISQSSAMSATDLQEVLDVMVTVTGNISYSMVSNSSTQAVFNNLTSVGDLTLDVAGSINMPLLENAGAVKFGTTHKNYVTAIEMPVLSSVTSFKTDSAADTIDFSKATAVTLTALANYDGATPASSKLTIAGKLDFTLDLAALTSKTAAGAKNPIALTIEGAKEVTLPLFTEGSVIANTSEKIVLATFEGGASDSFSKAEYLHLQAYERSLLAAQISTNLETLIFNGVAPATATTAAGHPSLNVTGASGLTTLTVSGKLNDVTMSGNTSLTDVTFSGSANDVVLSGATSLETAVLAHTGAAITTAESSLTVTGNTELTSLTVDALVNAGKLLITGNTSLETLSFAKLAGIGVAKVPMVDISNNNLTATSVDYTAAGTTAAAIAAGGTGSIVSESGLSTLKTYLGKAATASTAAGSYTYVAFDTVDKFINLSDEESGPFTYTVSNGKGLAANANLEVINVSPASGAEGAVAAVRSFIFDEHDDSVVYAGVTITVNANDSAVLGSAENAITNDIAGINTRLDATTDSNGVAKVADRVTLTNAGVSVAVVGRGAVGTLTVPVINDGKVATVSTTVANPVLTAVTLAGTYSASLAFQATRAGGTAATGVVSFTVASTGSDGSRAHTISDVNVVVTSAGSGYDTPNVTTLDNTATAAAIQTRLRLVTGAGAATVAAGTSTVTYSLGSARMTLGDTMKLTVGPKVLSYTIGWDDADATTKTILGLGEADLEMSIATAATNTSTVESLSANDIAAIANALLANSDYSTYVAATDLVTAGTTAAPKYDLGTYTSTVSGNVITVTSEKLGSSDSEKLLKLELSSAADASGANATKSTALGTFGSNGYAFGNMNFSEILVRFTANTAGIIGGAFTAFSGTNTPITGANLAGADTKVTSATLGAYLTANGVTNTVVTTASSNVDNYPTADFVFASDSVTASTAAATTNKVSWL